MRAGRLELALGLGLAECASAAGGVRIGGEGVLAPVLVWSRYYRDNVPLFFPWRVAATAMKALFKNQCRNLFKESH